MNKNTNISITKNGKVLVRVNDILMRIKEYKISTRVKELPCQDYVKV